jgi:hypothetical protein
MISGSTQLVRNWYEVQITYDHYQASSLKCTTACNAPSLRKYAWENQGYMRGPDESEELSEAAYKKSKSLLRYHGYII